MPRTIDNFRSCFHSAREYLEEIQHILDRAILGNESCTAIARDYEVHPDCILAIIREDLNRY
jgi:hypothetical protein